MNLKLLIADDEITIRRGLEKLIASFSLGLEIVGTAADGLQALELAERFRPEILVVDINMPQMDGLTLVEKLSALLPQSKCIILSGYSQFDYAQRALKLHVFDYLLKPINRSALYHSLKNAIDSYRERSLELGRLNLLPTADPEPEDLTERALAMIQSQYSDCELSLAQLAETLHTSVSALSRGIKQRTGKTFSDYLTAVRMEQALLYLASSDTVLIYDIANRIGYSSQHYFCRIFKEYTGMTPSEYRRKLNESR